MCLADDKRLNICSSTNIAVLVKLCHVMLNTELSVQQRVVRCSTKYKKRAHLHSTICHKIELD